MPINSNFKVGDLVEVLKGYEDIADGLLSSYGKPPYKVTSVSVNSAGEFVRIQGQQAGYRDRIFKKIHRPTFGDDSDLFEL